MKFIPILQNKIAIPYLLFLYHKNSAKKSEILKGLGVSPSTAALYHIVLLREGLTEINPENKKLIQLTKKGVQLSRTLMMCKDICEEAKEIFEKNNPELMKVLDNEIEKKHGKMLRSGKAASQLKKIFE